MDNFDDEALPLPNVSGAIILKKVNEKTKIMNNYQQSQNWKLTTLSYICKSCYVQQLCLVRADGVGIDNLFLISRPQLRG